MRFSILDPRYSLRARIALIVAVLALTLAIILTVATGEISGQQLEHSIGQNLAQLSSNVISQLDLTMFESWREMQLTANQHSLFSLPDNGASVRIALNQ